MCQKAMGHVTGWSVQQRVPAKTTHWKRCAMLSNSFYHYTKDTLDLVDRTLYRMVRIALQLCLPEDEAWLDGHVRTWRHAREAIRAACGCQPAALGAAFAVSGVQPRAARSACSLVSRIFRWSSFGRNPLDLGRRKTHTVGMSGRLPRNLLGRRLRRR